MTEKRPWGWSDFNTVWQNLRMPMLSSEQCFELGADEMLKALQKAGRLLSEEDAGYRRIGQIMRRARVAYNKAHVSK